MEVKERKAAEEQLAQQMAQKDPNNTEWAELAKDSFDFGLRAYERFVKKGSETKRTIFKNIGSDPILLDQNLQFQLRWLFIRYKKGIRTTNEEKSRLGPKISPKQQANLESKIKSAQERTRTSTPFRARRPKRRTYTISSLGQVQVIIILSRQKIFHLFIINEIQ